MKKDGLLLLAIALAHLDGVVVVAERVGVSRDLQAWYVDVLARGAICKLQNAISGQHLADLMNDLKALEYEMLAQIGGR